LVENQKDFKDQKQKEKNEKPEGGSDLDQPLYSLFVNKLPIKMNPFHWSVFIFLLFFSFTFF